MHPIISALAAAFLALTPGCVGLEESATDPPGATYPSEAEPVDSAAQAIGGFSAASFPFKTVLEDDGSDVGGGYQQANATLKFVDTRQSPSASWICTFTVGMPLRTARYGKVDAIHAAIFAAEAATLSAGPVMHSREVWLPTLFCLKFKERMFETFKTNFSGLGAGIIG